MTAELQDLEAMRRAQAALGPAFGGMADAARRMEAALLAAAPAVRRLYRAMFPGRFQYRRRYERRGRARARP